MWKNKIFGIILMFFGMGLLIIAYDKNQLPEDSWSSGNSVVRTKVDEIDNYGNVKNYPYTLRVQNQKEVYPLKNLSFSFWNEISFHRDQYLQGICFTEEYLLVSAYCETEDMLGEILIFDIETGEYLLTLGMDEKSHLGGVAYDGESIWVCNSTNKTIERFSYSILCQLLEQYKGKMINVTNLVEIYPVENTPSCIAFYNGRLWIATHQKWNRSWMGSYVYDKESDILKRENLYQIPAQVQGVVFDESGRVLFSTSYGRKQSSYLIAYTSLMHLATDIKNWEVVIEMPPCSEGVEIYEKKLYVLFESAGRKYYEGTDGYGTSLSPLNKILIIWDLAWLESF